MFFSSSGATLEYARFVTIYIAYEKIGGAGKMRISFVDSCLNGFKKWSDAQQVKEEPAAIEPRPEQAGRGAAAVRKEIASDAGS